ncbi:MAG: HWE histidine kinase domain-containing protein [Parvularcula sp.]|jgi:light-regulated signal transduction histidine kinase (bacteriophytochrome)/CheY-like chemotaxis protein|nr:HWE histidine kinase domain-containing protein [Parvularcula sp.]
MSDQKMAGVEPSGDVLRPRIDLTNCDREPIHQLGRVQCFGALIAVSSDWIVLHASENCGEIVGVDAKAIIGAPMREHFSDGLVDGLRGRLRHLNHNDAVERLFGMPLSEDGPLFDIALHVQGRRIIIEFEQHEDIPASRHRPSAYRLIERLSHFASVEAMSVKAAQLFREMIGFDRVMVYRFEPDETGVVIGEDRSEEAETFLGLRYPATDIPKQARELYKRNLVRVIADAKDEGARILPERGPGGEPLDLSLSTTRAVSPIHREYLRNMGVDASMSVSIIVGGKLWGLFACHHHSPRVPSYHLRTEAELFGQLFGFLVERLEGNSTREVQMRAQIIHDQLMAQLAEGTSLSDSFETLVEAIGSVIPHDGAISWISGEFQARGKTPSKEEFLPLVKFLNTTFASRVYHTAWISQAYPPGEDFVDRAAGMLVLPVSRSPRDYIVLFRQELVQEVRWAGNPDKPVEMGPSGDRLTPRKSFAAWQQEVRGQSRPFAPAEVEAAEAIRMTLLEVILRITDATMRTRAEAQEKQELLIAELNHRVRNVLNLIQSIVSQSRGEARSVTEFTQIIGGRIHALARAHDQITRENWKAASIHDLIRTEANAYLGDKADRLSVSGADGLLTPSAFTTLALVFHELLTNAMKYGALIDGNGHIEIELDWQEDDSLCILWREIGGPPISSPPTRRGFGRTIIERSIPFELKGDADLRFKTQGVEAEFFVPSPYLTPTGSKDKASAESVAKPAKGAVNLSGTVLILEDNMIIAMDAENYLYDLGAKTVEVCASNKAALAFLEEQSVDFALLDVNLGSETSEPTARRLEEMDIPFLFATGYGSNKQIKDQHPKAQVISKPYDLAAIETALNKLFLSD